MNEHGTAITALVRFRDTDIEVIDRDGNRWVTARQLAQALGYANTQKLTNLIDRHAAEFEGRQGVLNLSTPGGIQQVRTLNYHGVIRAAMLARTPKAKAFRDWAEDVLFEVMTRGSYGRSVEMGSLLKVQESLSKTLSLLAEQHGELARRVERIETGMPHALEFVTASDLIRELRPAEVEAWSIVRPGRKHRIGFNRGGHFDLFVARRYYETFQGWPRTGNPRHGRRRPEWIYPRTPEMVDFVLESFDEYKRHWSPVQRSLLNLVDARGRRGSHNGKQGRCNGPAPNRGQQ